MATKHKLNSTQLVKYFNTRSLNNQVKILHDAILHMEALAGKESMVDCIARSMQFWKSGEDTYILEDYAQEYPESELMDTTKRNWWVNKWLGNTYGLGDEDIITSGQVEELCEMLTYDLIKNI